MPAPGTFTIYGGQNGWIMIWSKLKKSFSRSPYVRTMDRVLRVHIKNKGHRPSCECNINVFVDFWQPIKPPLSVAHPEKKSQYFCTATIAHKSSITRTNQVMVFFFRIIAFSESTPLTRPQAMTHWITQPCTQHVKQP